MTRVRVATGYDVTQLHRAASLTPARSKRQIPPNGVGLRIQFDGLSLAFIGTARQSKAVAKTYNRAEAFSIRRLEGSRWRLRRTLMGFRCLLFHAMSEGS